MGEFAVRLATTEQTLFGTWVKIPALETVEMLAYAGFDYIVVDLEHAPLSLDAAYGAIVLSQSLGMGALVRVPDRSESHLQRILDVGADGILVPRVTDAAMCRQVVDGMRFSPVGLRGMGGTSRAGRWGLDPAGEYIRRGSDEVVRGVQLEDRGALAAIDDILAVDGVNAVFIGLGDLGLSSGAPANDPENDRLVGNTLERCRAAGVPCGTAVGGADAARACADRGFQFVMVSNDATLFGQAAADLHRAIVDGG
jgi:2-dehydro-3-deoxyglucarate aldolase/4-hydroxy-2-oxoheptanedioate aldolase